MFSRIAIIYLSVLVFVTIGISQELELITPQMMDLGTVMQDSVVKTVIRFRNSGDSPLNIARVQTSCGCTAADLHKKEYQPGEEGEIGVQFNTKGFSGLVRKYVSIYLENGEPNMTRVVLQSTIKSLVEIKPAYLDFQNIDIKNKENGRSLLVTNNFSDPLIIEGVMTNIKNLDIYFKEMTLKPGETEEIKITFEPYREGRADGYIDIKIKNPIKTVKRVPVFIYVKNADQG